MEPIASIEEAAKNGTIDQKIGQEYKFQEIDRVIGYLLRDWGFAGLSNTRELIPIPQNDYFYDGYYEAFSSYSSALDNFYHNLREKNEMGLFPLNPPHPITLLCILLLIIWDIIIHLRRHYKVLRYLSGEVMKG